MAIGLRFHTHPRTHGMRRHSGRLFLSPFTSGRVGVGDAEPPQNFGLDSFHVFGFCVLDVIEAQEMQEAVDDEMLEMMARRDGHVGGLARDRLAGEDDVAEVALGVRIARADGGLEGEGQDVGRGILAAIGLVEGGDGRIIREDDARALSDQPMGLGMPGQGFGRAMNCCGPIREGRPVARFLDDVERHAARWWLRLIDSRVGRLGGRRDGLSVGAHGF